MDNEETELTEFTDLNVKRQDAVEHPASGFGFLVKKAAAVGESEGDPNSTGCGCCEACNTHMAKDVNAVGGINEQPDIDGADQVLCQLYRLLEAEAREGAIGAHEECDVNILCEAISLIKWFKSNEEYGASEDDGNTMKASLEDEYIVAKAHRKFSSDERKRLASEGKALEDGSYPIPDADALRRAAILARSGHGDVAAAKKLIARRAKELGVKNPLDTDTQKDAPEVTEGTVETSEDTAKAAESAVPADTLSRDDVQKMIAEALTAETSQLREDNEKLSKELEVLKATPIPGGPALSATAADRAFKAKNEAVSKAAYHKRQAELTGDRDLIAYHMAKAAEFAAQAK